MTTDSTGVYHPSNLIAYSLSGARKTPSTMPPQASKAKQIISKVIFFLFFDFGFFSFISSSKEVSLEISLSTALFSSLSPWISPCPGAFTGIPPTIGGIPLSPPRVRGTPLLVGDVFIGGVPFREGTPLPPLCDMLELVPLIFA